MILKLEHIRFCFLKEQYLFTDLSLELEEGKICTLMGANGVGKTTLFNLITGFLKLQSGSIYFNDERIDKLTSFKINRKGICRTFQDLRLISKLTVRENILLAMHGNPTDNWIQALLPESFNRKKLIPIDEKANTIMSNYFLLEVQDSLAGEISFGQQKLLNLACCVANDADLLLLDEPVAGINPAYRNKIANILMQLISYGKTILMIEHNTEFIREVGSEIFFLLNGRVMQYNNLEIMKADARVLDAYM